MNIFGNNPYIQQQAKSIQDLSNQNLQQNVMPSIRSGATGAGQYGGTRQGIAEGRALSDYSKNEQRATEGKRPMPLFTCKDKNGCGWVKWPPKGQGTVPFWQADEQRLIHNAETHGIGAP